MEQAPQNPDISPVSLDDSNLPVAVKKTSRSLLVWILIGIVVLISYGAYVYLQRESGRNAAELETELPSQKPAEIPMGNSKIDVSQASSSLVFYNDGELWERESGVLRQLTSTNKSVSSFTVSKDNTLVAYITGDVQKNENGYALVTPKEVYLLEKQSGQAKMIHNVEPKTFSENTEYQRTLKSVGFSPSGKKIAITSSNALWMYDVATQKLDEIFFIEEQNLTKATIYGYFNPIFSKDETKIVLGVGYYEGSSQMYVDLITNQTRMLELSAYIQGERIVEHTDANNWLVLEWGSSIDGEPWTNIYSINLDTNEKKLLKSIQAVSSTTMIKTKDAYVLSGLTYWERPNEEGVMLSGNDQRIFSWNDKTDEIKILLDAPQNDEDNKRSSSINLIQSMSLNTNDFYISITDNIYGQGGHNEYRIQKYNSNTQEFETIEYNASLLVYR